MTNRPEVQSQGEVTVLHLALDDDTSGFFPQLARWHDRSRFRMMFGTLRPMAAWLREWMERQGVGCISLDAEPRSAYPLAWLRLFRLLRSLRVDVLHAHLFDPSVIGLSAAFLARTPVRVLTRHHSNYHTRINKGIHVGLDKLCTRLSDAVIAVSRHTGEHLCGVEGAPASKVRVIPNGIDFERVRVSNASAPAALKRDLAPDGAALLLTAARLHPEKGLEHLFQALPMLARLCSRPFVLAVAGTGPFETQYKRMVEDLGCAGQVRFLGFRRDLPDLMAAADIFVLPSLAEAFGLAIVEALFLGTPVISTRVGAIPEIVEDGVDGILVPPADPEALAAVLARLLGDPGELSKLAGAGRRRIKERYRFESMLRQYEALYDELLRGVSRRA